jgi:hypothetical protein
LVVRLQTRKAHRRLWQQPALALRRRQRGAAASSSQIGCTPPPPPHRVAMGLDRPRLRSAADAFGRAGRRAGDRPGLTRTQDRRRPSVLRRRAHSTGARRRGPRRPANHQPRRRLPSSTPLAPVAPGPRPRVVEVRDSEEGSGGRGLLRLYTRSVLQVSLQAGPPLRRTTSPRRHTFVLRATLGQESYARSGSGLRSGVTRQCASLLCWAGLPHALPLSPFWPRIVSLGWLRNDRA